MKQSKKAKEIQIKSNSKLNAIKMILFRKKRKSKCNKIKIKRINLNKIQIKLKYFN